MSQTFLRQDYKIEAKNVHRILDLGANVGMATLYLHRLFPDAKFACVEASPRNWGMLKRTVELNQIPARIFEAAIGAEEGKIDLYLSANPDCNSVVPGQEPDTQVVSVPLISVPYVLEQMGWDSIDVLKLDIEGAEKFVIRQNNEWLSRVRIIVGESHVGVDYTYAQVIEDLAAFGFEFKTVIEETEIHGAGFVAFNRRLEPAEAHASTATA